MNLNSPSLLVVLIGLIVSVGCSSSSTTSGPPGGSPMKRIDANREAYETWPIEVRMAILDGRIIEGMTREQVQMALGDPTQTGSRMGRGGEVEEIWEYRSGGGGGNILTDIASSVSLGTGIGGVGIGSRGIPGVGQGNTPVEVGQVVFVDGRVVNANVGP